jgi:hypothetical protein
MWYAVVSRVLLARVRARAPYAAVDCVWRIVQRRYKEDLHVNNVQYKVIRDGRLVRTASKDIHCGDVVQLLCDEMVPADMILLRSSHREGQAFVNTANLDGCVALSLSAAAAAAGVSANAQCACAAARSETNLKVRKAVPATINRDPSVLSGDILCDPPNPALYAFTGVLRLDPDEIKPADAGGARARERNSLTVDLWRRSTWIAHAHTASLGSRCARALRQRARCR